MIKNTLIIFSKNRAMQLDLLLNSLYINSKNVYNSIIVLYKVDEGHSVSYETLKKQHEDIVFFEEKNFKDDLIDIIENSLSHLITFMVDDDIMYGKHSLSETQIILEVIKDNGYNCFSLRLGLNCNYSHPANLHYKVVNQEKITDDIFSINLREQQMGDFNYPISLDGHIF